MTVRARVKVASRNNSLAVQMMTRITCLAFIVVAIWVIGMQAARAQGPAPVADLAEKLSPAVVNISTSQKATSGGVPVPNVPEGTPFREFFEEFFKKQQEGQSPNRPNRPRNANSLGSGFYLKLL